MADVYELNTIADLLKIPPEKLGECLRDIEYAIDLCHLAGGEHAVGMSFDSFKWTDDGKHDVDMAMNGEPLLKLSVTEESALSHAAGQEAVAWMRRNVTYKAVDGRTDGERVVSERKVYDDDLPLYLRQDGEQCRAASGEDAYVIEQMGRLLAEIAVIVNGPEPPMTRWSYHDLPEKVRALSRGVPEGK